MEMAREPGARTLPDSLTSSCSHRDAHEAEWQAKTNRPPTSRVLEYVSYPHLLTSAP